MIQLRLQQSRNLLATVLFSQGVPMLLAGDEIGHTQLGNNNAYCQDNELSWLNWELAEGEQKLLAFVQRIIMLRKKHPLLHRRTFFRGQTSKDTSMKDISWLTCDGQEMTDEKWKQSSAKCLGVIFAGAGLQEADARGQLITDDNLLLLLNAGDEDVEFMLPLNGHDADWRVLMDSTWDDYAQRCIHEAQKTYSLKARTLAIFIEHQRKDRRIEP